MKNYDFSWTKNPNLSDLPWGHRVTNQNKPKPHPGQRWALVGSPSRCSEWWMPAWVQLSYYALCQNPQKPQTPSTSITDYNILRQTTDFIQINCSTGREFSILFPYLKGGCCCSCWRNTKWPDFWSVKEPALESGGTWGQALFWRFMCQ